LYAPALTLGGSALKFSYAPPAAGLSAGKDTTPPDDIVDDTVGHVRAYVPPSFTNSKCKK
jgi:hypothetical protein